jgi:hypothetical protein
MRGNPPVTRQEVTREPPKRRQISGRLSLNCHTFSGGMSKASSPKWWRTRNLHPVSFTAHPDVYERESRMLSVFGPGARNEA